MPTTGVAGHSPRLHPNHAQSGTPHPSSSTIALPPQLKRAVDGPGLATDRNGVPMRLRRLVMMAMGDQRLRLRNIDRSIRVIIRQHESAWVDLRPLYNAVIVLHKMLDRVRDMVMYASEAGVVASIVNRGGPGDLGRGFGTDASVGGVSGTADIPAEYDRIAQRRTPVAWCKRFLPKAEKLIPEMYYVLRDLEMSCRSAMQGHHSKLLRNHASPGANRWDNVFIWNTVRSLNQFHSNFETHMTSCKFVHIVSLESLYNNPEVLDDPLDEDDPPVMLHHDEDINEIPRFFNYWERFGFMLPNKAALDNWKKKRRKVADKAKKAKKTASKIKTVKENQPRPVSSRDDLVAAIQRKDYLTIVTILMSDLDLNDLTTDGTSALAHAVSDDNAALVSVLGVCEANPNLPAAGGVTPLHVAATGGYLAPAIVLLDLGAHADITDDNGLTPLHVACRERHLSIVLQLLSHGADPNRCDNRGVTPLGYALLHPKRAIPSRDIISALLTYGARATSRRCNLMPITDAVLRFDSKLLPRYLRECPSMVDIETQVATSREDVTEMRPLFAAIIIGNIYALNLLLRYGADIHRLTSACRQDVTYLNLAVLSECAPIVARLLLAGADPNMCNSSGRTPLHLAASVTRGDIEVTKLLLRHGSDPQAATFIRHSQPLHMAVRAGRGDVTDALLKAGADINRPLRSGVTPVMLAVYHWNKMMVRFLVSRGADIHYATPIYCETAMHTACRVGNVMIAKYLLQQGLSVEAAEGDRDSTDDTSVYDSDSDSECDGRYDRARRRLSKTGGYAPLHAAASHGQYEMVSWLLSHGANPHVRVGMTAARACLIKGNKSVDIRKGTPADVARAFGHHKVVELLEDHIAKEMDSRKAATKSNPETPAATVPITTATTDGTVNTLPSAPTNAAPTPSFVPPAMAGSIPQPPPPPPGVFASAMSGITFMKHGHTSKSGYDTGDDTEVHDEDDNADISD